jgi:hypothetical protein
LVQLFDTFKDQLFCRDVFVPQQVDLELNISCELIEIILRIGQEIGLSTAGGDQILNTSASFKESGEGINGFLSELSEGRTHGNVSEFIKELLKLLQISIHLTLLKLRNSYFETFESVGTV